MRGLVALAVGLTIYSVLFALYTYVLTKGESFYFGSAAIESITVVPAIVLGSRARKRAAGKPFGQRLVAICIGCAIGSVVMALLFEASKVNINLTQKIFGQLTHESGSITLFGLGVEASFALASFIIAVSSVALSDLLRPGPVAP